MPNMTFQEEDGYIVCYIDGKEVSRSKKAADGTSTAEVIDIINEQIKANPTLVGTETALTGLQVGDTKYAVPQGSGGIEYVELQFNSETTLEISITQAQATSLQNGAFIKATDTSVNNDVLMLPTTNNNYSSNIVASGITIPSGHHSVRVIFIVADIDYSTLKVNFSIWNLDGTRVVPQMPEDPE